MKRKFVLLSAVSLALSGCMVVPVAVEEPQASSFCPPGQAMKGNCRAESDRGFCPPGQAKKGNC